MDDFFTDGSSEVSEEGEGVWDFDESDTDEYGYDADENGNLAGFVVDDVNDVDDEYWSSDSAPKKKKKRQRGGAKRTREKPVSAAEKARAERVAHKQKLKLEKRRRGRQLKLFDRMVGNLCNEPVRLWTEEEALFVKGVRALTREKDTDKGYCSDTGVERAKRSIRALHTTHTTSKLFSVARRDTNGKLLVVVGDLPDFAKCPITQDLLKQPMTDVVSGHTFEREAIVKWLQINPVNPLTRAPLREEDLFLNRPLQKALQLLA